MAALLYYIALLLHSCTMQLICYCSKPLYGRTLVLHCSTAALLNYVADMLLYYIDALLYSCTTPPLCYCTMQTRMQAGPARRKALRPVCKRGHKSHTVAVA